MDKSVWVGKGVGVHSFPKMQIFAHLGKLAAPKVIATVCAITVTGAGIGKVAVDHYHQVAQAEAAEFAVAEVADELTAPAADETALAAAQTKAELAAASTADAVEFDQAMDAAVLETVPAVDKVVEAVAEVSPIVEEMVVEVPDTVVPDAIVQAPAPSTPIVNVVPEVMPSVPDTPITEVVPDTPITEVVPDAPAEEIVPSVPDTPAIDEGQPELPGGDSDISGGDNGGVPGGVVPDDKDDENTEEPDTEETDTEEPDTEEPDTEEPDTEEPDTEEPDTEEPEPEEPEQVIIGYEEHVWYVIVTEAETLYVSESTWNWVVENDFDYINGSRVVCYAKEVCLIAIWGPKEDAPEVPTEDTAGASAEDPKEE